MLGEALEALLALAILFGIAVFMWSVATSMERIATALTRLADREKPRTDSAGISS